MNDLGFWFAMFVLGALAYYETPLGRVIRAGVRMLWEVSGYAAPVDGAEESEATEHRARRVLPIRRANGQLAGSVPYRKSTEPISTSSSAVESEFPDGNRVPDFPLTIPDMLIIAAKLGQGMTPTNVAKSLPGYSGRKHSEYGERVRHVRAILEEHGALSEAPEE